MSTRTSCIGHLKKRRKRTKILFCFWHFLRVQAWVITVTNGIILINHCCTRRTSCCAPASSRKNRIPRLRTPSVLATCILHLQRQHFLKGLDQGIGTDDVYAAMHRLFTCPVCVRTASDPLWPRFAATSVVNVTASVAKDAAFTRMFGTSKAKPLPVSTLMLFAGRDCMTIAAR